MTTRRRLGTGASVLLFAFATGLAAQSKAASGPLALLESASAKYAAARSMCADFTQRLTVPLLSQEQTGRGRLCQAQPDLFAMRFTDPGGDAVVVDGTHVWVYYPSMDATQVVRFPVADAPGGFDFHRQFLDRPAEKYRIQDAGAETLAGRPTHKIRLVPKTPDSFQAAVVWIGDADHLLRRVVVEEENGSTRTVTLDRIDLGAKAPAGWFTFTPPAGTQVIVR